MAGKPFTVRKVVVVSKVLADGSGWRPNFFRKTDLPYEMTTVFSKTIRGISGSSLSLYAVTSLERMYVLEMVLPPGYTQKGLATNLSIL